MAQQSELTNRAAVVGQQTDADIVHASPMVDGREPVGLRQDQQIPFPITCLHFFGEAGEGYGFGGARSGWIGENAEPGVGLDDQTGLTIDRHDSVLSVPEEDEVVL